MRPALFAVGFAAATGAVIAAGYLALRLIADGITAGLTLFALALGA